MWDDTGLLPQLDGYKTNTRSNCLFSEFHIKLTCCNDNSYRPSMTDKGVEISESVEEDQEMSDRLKLPKTIKRSLSER